ncbi:MAG: c-type cytochrome domain-containing protein [Chryseolinea sp.]
MDVFKKLIVNIVFAVQVLLVFLLVFEQQLELPSWLQAFGRLHPLLLHLPIGLLILTGILIVTRKYFESESFDSLIGFLLHLSALTTSLTALMGLFLSREGGYAEGDLVWHKWLGVTLSFLCSFLIFIQLRKKLFHASIAISILVLIIAGHLGANLTHGESFVLGPLEKIEPKIRIINDSSTVFEAAIDPVLESKCYSCHNNRKAKGGLILTSIEDILKGGKDGELWESGKAENSLLIKRLLLPTSHKEHMPPQDKQQLSEDELSLFTVWINSGAQIKRKLTEYSNEDSLKKLAAIITDRYIKHQEPSSIYHFAFASPEKIEKLSNPYRSVFQFARSEPALQVDFFVRQAFQKKYLEELAEVKEQIVYLNLSNMPIEDEDLKVLQSFKNIEVLNLNNTNITLSGLTLLKSLSNLKSLSISGTKINVASLNAITSLPNLQKVFVWNTSIQEGDLTALRTQFPSIDWEIGYVPDTKEVLQLSPPILVNEMSVLNQDEKIILKASLPGTIIRYTTDNTLPDSITGLFYDKPLSASGYTIVKAKACKDGWISSEVSEFIFFMKGYRPNKAELLQPADERYPGEGVTTLIDNKKGIVDFFKDPTWIAFIKNPMEAVFYFNEQPPTIHSLTISYSKNVGAMTMPPQHVEVWGGSDSQHLTLLKKVTPDQPTEYGQSKTEGLVISIPPSTFPCYKLIAKPLGKLPAFRKAEAKDKAWLMVDEVFFN